MIFSREGEQQREPVELSVMVKEMLTLLRPVIPKLVEVRLDLEENCGLVLGDSSQIGQVIMNLITNACLAVGDERGRLDIRLREVRPGKKELLLNPDLEEKNYAELTIKDTGAGMDKETMERIFEPFFTTRDIGKGSGLGLSIAQGVVKSHGAAIAVESAPGKGSAFVIYLPSHNKLPHAKQPQKAKQGLEGNERILLVDDDVDVAQSMKASLERLGYRVIVQTGSAQALEFFRADPAAFDVVLTDQSMPVMTGTHLAKELIGLRPDLPILLITGLGEVLSEQEINFLGVSDCIQKPVASAELSLVIRKAVEKKKH